MYTALFLTKYVDYIYFPYYSMLVISFTQALGMGLLSFKNILNKAKNVFALLYLLSLVALSQTNISSSVGINVFCLFIVSAFYQTEIIKIIEQKKEKFNALYLIEMFGAILGVAGWLAITEKIGFQGFIIIHVSVFIFSVVISDLTNISKILKIILATGLLFFVNEPQPLFNKRDRYQLIDKGQLLDVKWNTVAHVELVESQQFPNRKIILFDGGLLRSIVYEFNGNFSDLREKMLKSINVGVWSLDVVLPAFTLKDQMNNVLLISVVGGQEIMAAKAFGAKQIYAVDVNSAAQKYSHTRLNEYNGKIYENNVHVYTKDGRQLAEELNLKFDLIQIFSASNAAFMSGLGSGLRPSSLITADAIETYFDKLTDNGILNLSQANYPQIKKTIEYVSQKRNYQNNILAIRPAFEEAMIKSFYVKKSAWTKEQIEEIINWLGQDRKNKWDILIDPFEGETKSGKELSNLFPASKNKDKIATDDWPFVNLIQHPLELPQAQALSLVFVLLIVGFLAYTYLIAKMKNNKSLSFFFIGLLFGLLQQSLMHLLQKNIGRPDYGLGVTLILCLFISICTIYLSTVKNKINYKLAFFALFFTLIAIAIKNELSMVFGLVTIIFFQSLLFIKLIQQENNQIRWAWGTNGLGFVLGVCSYFLIFSLIGFTLTVGLMLLGYLMLFYYFKKL